MPVNLLNEKDLNNYLADIVYHGQEMEVFKSGDFKSIAYVEQNKDAIVRSMLLQWFKHRLRSYLAEDLPEHKDFLLPIRANEKGLPAWAERCLAQGNPVHRFEADKIPSTLTDNISKIRDFLYSAAESYVNKTLARIKDTNAKGKEQISPKLRIDYLKTQEAYDTFAKTLAEAEKWHSIMAKKAELRKRNEKMYQASLSGTQSVMKLADGMEIVQLTTPEALDYESEYMGHCVGSGGYDQAVKKGNIKIYSLRDADGMPHATFEVRTGMGKNGKDAVFQCKGKGNDAPVAKYRPYVQEFVKTMDFDIAGDRNNIGLITLYDEETGQSQRYDLFNIPKGKKLICKGDLDISGMGLDEMPDLSNIVVEGNFYCRNNKLSSLKGAPQEVRGDFDCSYNQLSSLEGAPQEVRGDFDCSYNQLSSLEGAPKEVGESFHCHNNQLTSLKYAPQEVGGNFHCHNNQLTSLEYAPQKVEGGFYCHTNQLCSLEGAPKEVRGDFDCSYNQLSSLEGTPKEVRGDFDCSYNQLSSLEGAPQEVRGDFDCSYNQLCSLEGAPQKVEGGFYCYNNQLTSLKYAPQKVRNFDCSHNQLTSLEGAPQEVRDFDCSHNQLTSLKYAPQKVRNFDCSHNQLTSLKYAPQKVRNFDCSHNQLTSLEYAPQEVRGDFDCSSNQLTSLKGAPKTVVIEFTCYNNQLASLVGVPVCEFVAPDKNLMQKYSITGVNIRYKKLLLNPTFLLEKMRRKISKGPEKNSSASTQSHDLSSKTTLTTKLLSLFKKITHT